MTAATAQPTSDAERVDVGVLRELEKRVLWLSTAIVHHANKVRENRSGIKVGGHQASSASIVTIMTALWFAFLEGQDRVSVKPHASPVLHAINYLLGGLPAEYLTRLRELGGLQSYPSRTKDPDDVDYSTGSVGIGATATIWGALTHRYVAGHFEVPVGGRHVALVGDAELDEGACWEALLDPVTRDLGELLWIIDLNRQSLDRVVPQIAADRLRSMFEAAGWHTSTVKYGRRLQTLFRQSGGAELRRRIDEMSNEEFQSLLRANPADLRQRLPGEDRGSRQLAKLVAELRDADLSAAIRDLGGHDLGALLQGLEEADAAKDRPSVIFAYTIKGWRLPIEGHPANHSALLSQEQFHELGLSLGANPSDPWAPFPADSRAAQWCRERADQLQREPPSQAAPPAVPVEFGRQHRGEESTQQAFGRFFSDLHREAEDVSRRVVTVSPDVASSTNLGGWINRVGIWSIGDRIDWFADDTETLVRWREIKHGQHIELGIAETNLVGLLGELGAAWRVEGEPLLPVGTLYDPFVGRALEPWSFGIYGGGQSILVGTPSGITLASEGGAHQSIVTPAIGVAQPGCVFWEPAFAQDFEWAFLHALSRLGRADGISSYFRLSTRPIAQEFANLPSDDDSRNWRRAQVLAGGYRLRESRASGPGIALVGTGAVMPEVIDAAAVLEAGGIPVDVVCVTSADLLFRSARADWGFGSQRAGFLHEILPRGWPIVTVLDGHPSALAFLGAALGVSATCLGVADFGQSGDQPDLYEHYGIDSESIIGAALDLAGP
ncbi:MAG: transketolase-like TK C-terminal-containing protein [Solirubrobacterales bacterium]